MKELLEIVRRIADILFIIGLLGIGVYLMRFSDCLLLWQISWGYVSIYIIAKLIKAIIKSFKECNVY